MLKTIGDVKNIKKFIDKAKDKNDPFRLMGFGHRVYKTTIQGLKLCKKHVTKFLMKSEEPMINY